MIIEWIWLGSTPVWKVLVCVVMILTGVALSLVQSPGAAIPSERSGSFTIGAIAAVLAGFGQGCGAVISRKAERVATLVAVLFRSAVAGLQHLLERLEAGCAKGGGGLRASLEILVLEARDQPLAKPAVILGEGGRQARSLGPDRGLGIRERSAQQRRGRLIAGLGDGREAALDAQARLARARDADENFVHLPPREVDSAPERSLGWPEPAPVDSAAKGSTA